MTSIKISILSFFLLGTLLNAQVAIEKQTVDGSGILDFPEGTTKGIILPRVTDANSMTGTSEGTFVFDTASARIKFFNGNEWLDFSGQSGVNPTIITANEKATEQGVVIGTDSTDTKGVLVLEAEDKALILPKIIDPVNSVKSPTAGMMCYDPDKNLVCFYNGSKWSFWGNID